MKVDWVDVRFGILLCDVIGLEETARAGLETNAQRAERREEVTELVQARLGTSRAEQWAARLMEAGVPASKINDLPDVFASEHVKQGRLVQTVELPDSGETSFVGPPVLIDARRPQIRSAPPLLGDAQAALLETPAVADGDGKSSSVRDMAWERDSVFCMRRTESA
jgi:crotonobetainyl-CoA:carnitine CoA-transferase CaiB-like acyl-CoA transferase